MRYVRRLLCSFGYHKIHVMRTQPGHSQVKVCLWCISSWKRGVDSLHWDRE